MNPYHPTHSTYLPPVFCLSLSSSRFSNVVKGSGSSPNS